MYYTILPTAEMRDAAMQALKDIGINAIFHYIPLHSSPAGQRYARVSGSMVHTDSLSARLLRLPLWNHMDAAIGHRVAEAVHSVLTKY
jgi:dTDP-4-amino-4,6-dideoxygalactose transaminase